MIGRTRITRKPDYTETTCPLVEKYRYIQPVDPKHLHGNDKRLHANRERVHAELKAWAESRADA